MQSLDRVGVGYKILATNTARDLLKDHPHRVPLPEEVSDLWRQRSPSAWHAQGQLNLALSVPCVVTGLVSEFQQKWATYFRHAGKAVVGYWDGFDVDWLRNAADPFRQVLTHLMTPSRDTAAIFQRRFPNIPVVPLGQPTLESIPMTMQGTSAQSLANALNLDLNKPTLLFVGGYGPGYAEAFSLFCESAKTFKNANLLVSLHPKVSGEGESAILQSLEPNQSIQVIPKSITTAEVLKIADVVLSQDSTMTVQSLLQGKQVMLVGEPISQTVASKFNPATYYGLVKRYGTSPSLTRALESQLFQRAQEMSTNRPSNLQAFLGIPTRATENITRYLLSLLSFSRLPWAA